MNYCCINGQRIEADKAFIAIQDRGFRYGDGVFETIAVHGAVPYQFEWHMNRLQHGLNAIKIKYDITSLPENCRKLIHDNHVAEGLLRIQITRGVGSKGYLPALESSPTVVIETSAIPEIVDKRGALWQSNYCKISPHALPIQYKLCQGLNSTLARTEAQENHCFDALLLNESGQLCETSSGNIFWRKKGAVYTPSLSCGILEGSTRAALLRLHPDINETEATLDTLLHADAVCVTNVVWKAFPVYGLMPVGVQWDSKEFADHLTILLDADRQDYCQLQLSSR